MRTAGVVLGRLAGGARGDAWGEGGPAAFKRGPLLLAYYAKAWYEHRSPEGQKTMPTRNVVLTDHHEKIVATLVSSGRYQNASEVLREGLRLVEAREAREAAKLNALREAAQFGFADLDAGRYREFGYDELESVIEALGQQASDQVRNSAR